MKQSIIAQLRKHYPGEWKAVRQGFGWMYVGPIGTVRRYAQLSPKFDGDDESFITVYCDEKGRMIGSGGFIFDTQSKEMPCRQ